MILYRDFIARERPADSWRWRFRVLAASSGKSCTFQPARQHLVGRYSGDYQGHLLRLLRAQERSQLTSFRT